MRGLILKDILTLRKYSNSVIAIIGFFTIFSFTTNDSGVISGMIVFLFAMMAITSFSYDELAKWDVYALSLPVSRKDVVFGKYLLAVLLTTIGTLLAVLAGLLISIFKSTSNSELLVSCYGLFCASIIFISVLFPLIYKFGIERARILILIVFAIPTLIMHLLERMGMPVPDESQLVHLAKAVSVFLPVFLCFSAYISLQIYKHKEM